MNNSQALRRLRALGLRPKKSFGQNFLTAEPLCDRIAELALTTASQPPTTAGHDTSTAQHDTTTAQHGTTRAGCVLEIGAGLGALTAALLERAERVIAIERDRDLLPILHERFADEPKLQLIEADAVRQPWWPLLADGPSPRIICGNLPYQLTGRLIRKLTELSPRIDRAVIMVQREVAERLSARPGSSSYSALTVFVNAAFSVERALKVGAGAFVPPPKVDSAVIVLTPLSPPRAEENDTFQQVVKGAFSQRRKRLSNSLRKAAPSPEALQAAAAEAGVDLSARAETLTVEQFAALSRALDSA